MERKGISTVEVTAKEVQSALPRSRTLSSEEEKALRMRFGGKVTDKSAPLPKAAAGNDELEDELLLIEMRLLRAWKMRLGQQKAPVAQSHNPTKDKIVRALRKKK